MTAAGTMQHDTAGSATPLTRRTRTWHTYLTGQYDNLGDALLRRAMVDALAGVGPLHVYVGAAPADYVAALRLPASSHVYRSRLRWIAATAAHMVRPGRSVFLGNPGEISSSRTELALGTVSAALMTLGRLSGNPGYRTGVGARDRRRPWSLGHEWAHRVATRRVWRDDVSRAMYGDGIVAPDWAFALAPHDARAPRDLVVLSYRGDMPRPTATALSTVRDWSRSRHLELVVISMVGRDVDENERTAAELGIRHIHAQNGGLEEAERVTRDAFARAQIVLSNRIHVLIVGAVDGATPGAVLAHSDLKAARTMRGANVPFSSVSAGATPAELVAYLDDLSDGDDAVARAVQAAAQRVKRLGASLRDGPT